MPNTSVLVLGCTEGQAEVCRHLQLSATASQADFQVYPLGFLYSILGINLFYKDKRGRDILSRRIS